MHSLDQVQDLNILSIHLSIYPVHQTFKSGHLWVSLALKLQSIQVVCRQFKARNTYGGILGEDEKSK